MTKVRVFAPAKINLSLHITGQLNNGYHLIDSLVAFADIGDWITLTEHGLRELSVTGPEAVPDLSSDTNIMWHAAQKFWSPDRPLSMGLEKHLPMASGIGGGSADAAATYRGLLLLRAAVEGAGTPRDPTPADARDLLAIGADVPMCVLSDPARIQGIGEQITPVPELFPYAIVLVNPRVQVSTPAVFSKLAIKDNPGLDPWPDRFEDRDAALAWIAAQRNDLQVPAIANCPDIADVLSALKRIETCRLARMSGSGATCFGIFERVHLAQAAAEAIRAAYPDWWVRSGRLNGGKQAVPQLIRSTT
ncbi:4-(cytidine 5'-diphospho)-2-C-methyl-D-erythritol kinase [Tateyamaria armeniaca]|uniref:4-diphosphocytidyl-2-C-methyl-D-erythritol kinase n=1 Tax=Tateyamaria armeniaca TaxID=2518930 RepID=A0ABW8UTM7_9RHOB